MYIHTLSLYMQLLLFAKGRNPYIMQHYIQSPIFDEKRGRMYVRYATYLGASTATNEVNFVILLGKEMD